MCVYIFGKSRPSRPSQLYLPLTRFARYYAILRSIAQCPCFIFYFTALSFGRAYVNQALQDVIALQRQGCCGSIALLRK